MSVSVEAYEKLGAFYLGRHYDVDTKAVQDAALLYDSKDLVTHGVVLGMTGSGKTGLCVALLEEAAMDSIPAIVIDPKGDIPNLMLTFPDLKGADFRPWVNEDEATKKGQNVDEHAEAQARLWRRGLAEWGQSGERIRELRERVEINILTPGSSAGIPVSILSSFDAPEFEVLDDPELLGDRVSQTASSLLGLIGVDADPMQSREHILLSHIFLERWRREEDLTLPKLIESVQRPPFTSVGVVPLESFMEETQRFELAMRLNHLLASPRFQSWTHGIPLDVKSLLHNEAGKPRISILTIAHLDEAERMFVVSMLLNQVLSWMRTQPGTSSLRALLYMDELYGYLPPVANPPSKKPLMTLLKQARAFGLGVLLATQNPVDLDYKALSNIGSWFLGRLQTERDRARVLDGVESVAASQGMGFERSKLGTLLANLDSRVFVLRSVHEDVPVTFCVRWVMSYLRGPLSRGQIKTLMDPVRNRIQPDPGVEDAREGGAPTREAPVIYQLSSEIDQVYFPISELPGNARVIYRPAVMGVGEMMFDRAKLDIRHTRSVTLLCPLEASTSSSSRQLDFDRATRIDGPPRGLEDVPVDGAERAGLPDHAQEAKYYSGLKTPLKNWLYQNIALEVFACPELDAHSRAGETEAEFRIRLQQDAREKRDEALEALREKYARRLEAKKRQLDAALERLERERAQAHRAKTSTFISIGTTLLSAVLGRRRAGLGTISRGATAARGVSRTVQEARDADAAEDTVQQVEGEIAAMEEALESEIETVRQTLDPLTLPLEKRRIRPYKKDIFVQRLALAWLPYLRISDAEVKPAWRLRKTGEG